MSTDGPPAGRPGELGKVTTLLGDHQIISGTCVSGFRTYEGGCFRFCFPTADRLSRRQPVEGGWLCDE
jgi:hypothetical protein